jgi:hypothetical protein
MNDSFLRDAKKVGRLLTSPKFRFAAKTAEVPSEETEDAEKQVKLLLNLLRSKRAVGEPTVIDFKDLPKAA